MNMKNSVQNKNKTYQYIVNYIVKNGFPPSVREICQALNFNSTSTASYYLKALESEGKISRNKYKNRAIELVETKYSPTTVNVPILGNVAAGIPIDAIENKEDEVTFSSRFFSGTDLFMLHVKGDSMVNAGIFNGDYLVVNRQSIANNGEIVVAMIDNEVTVKRFYRENGMFRLQPENNLMNPIYVDELDIIGKVVGLIRNI